MAPRAAAAYKKQNGIVAISKDRKSLSWSPAQPPDASPTLVLSVPTVENLQQTPETSAKVMLKVFAKTPGQVEALAHTFTFTSSSDARAECITIREALAKAIQEYKAEQAAKAATSSGQSAAMTIANAISGKSSWEDDEKLKTDVKLQQSLMAEDPNLQKTFLEARNLKPESISMTQFTAQFWSSRLHLLRAHALEKSQGRGRNSVFSMVRKEDGGRSMNLTAEQIRDIFYQYPVMKGIYDESVPKKISNEVEFWSRFFQSQLYDALRGLKLDRDAEKDAVLDTYLEVPEVMGLRAKSTSSYIPKFIDLEGNEENNSQRKGNLERVEQNQMVLDRAPVIRKLNALSEKLIAAVKPSETDVSAPIGMDESEYEALRLRDLAGETEQNRIILNIRDQSRFFTEREPSKGDNLNPFRKQDPAKAVKDVCADITSHFPQPGQGPIPIAPFDNEEYYDEDDDDAPASGATTALDHITSLVKAHKDQTAEIDATSGLPTSIYERVTLTHATTIEFLRQFWSAFLSGDPKRADEIASLVESLNRALDRINTIADDADDMRNTIIKTVERDAAEILRKTGKKKRIAEVGGGGKVVKQLMEPIIGSLGTAVKRYKEAYEEQSKETGTEDGGG